MSGPRLLPDQLLPPWQLTTQQDQGNLGKLLVVTPDEELLLLVLFHQQTAEQLHQLLPLLLWNVDQFDGSCCVNFWPDLLYVDKDLDIQSRILSEDFMPGILGKEISNMMPAAEEQKCV